jgi:hypothetical protein
MNIGIHEKYHWLLSDFNETWKAATSTQQPFKLQTLYLQYNCVAATDFDDMYRFNIISVINMPVFARSIFLYSQM